MNESERKELQALLLLIRDQADVLAGSYGGDVSAADIFVLRALVGLAEAHVKPKPRPPAKPKPAKKRRRKKAKKRATRKPKPKPKSYADKLAEAAGDKK